jgi:2-dehydropantoate 2-reductase
MKNSDVKFAVIGTGGVGGYFGARIANAGYPVTFVARGEHLKAIRSNGLRIKSINGDFSVHPARVTDQVGDTSDATHFILGMKAWHVAGVARELRNIIRPDAVILPLQNGVSAFDELAAEIDASHILQGLCRIFSKIESPGVINHLGFDPVIIFGETDNKKTERTEALKGIFDQAGIKSRIAEDIHSELWKKFINICAGGLLAVTRSTYGEIREIQETRQLMNSLFEEIYALSQEMGICIENDFVARTMSFVDSFSYDATSSMTRDIWEGKPSEIEYQNGTVVRLGEQYGVKTPVNKFIYECILPMERKARQQVMTARSQN